MADEKVTIKIEVRSDDGAIDRTRRKLERLSGAEGRHYKKNSALASKGSSDIKNYGKNTDDVLKNGSRKWKKHFDQLDKSMKMFGGGLLKLVAMSAKMAAVEIAGMGLAMVAVHGAFLIGKGLAKAYQVAMQGAAAGVAGLAIAAGTAAAAVREQQAAMFAFSQKGHKEFGNGLNQTRVVMRSLTHDADLAAVGVENLTSAYGEIVNKSGKFNAGSAKMLKGLMDFASAGQDLKTGTKAAAGLVAELQNVKGTYSSIKTAAQGLGPQMKKALEEYEKAGGAKKGKAGLVEAITSGELARLGGVAGQFEAINSTLINQAKGFFTQIKNEFADFGQQFLEPVKTEFRESFAIIKRTLQRLTGEFAIFANSGFLENISVLVEKVSNGTVNLIRKYLPAAQGMFKRFGDWWDKFTDGWKTMVDRLRPMQEGARVIEDMVKNVMMPIWDELKNKFGTFNQNLQKYRKDFENFGTAVGNLVVKVMQYGAEVQQIFFESLPFINKVIDGVTTLIEHFTSFLGGFKKVTGVVEKFLGGKGFGNFMLLAGLITYGKKMKATTGGFVSGTSMSGIREAANMNLTAGVVNINGKPVAGYGRPGLPGHTTTPTSTGGTVTRGSASTTSGPYPGVTPGRPGAPGFASGGVPAAMTSVAGAANMATTALTTLAGVASGSSRATAGGAARGPNGGYLIRSGKYKGQELLQQSVGGQNPRYVYGGRGTGPVDQARLRATGQEFRSGVYVPAEYRTDEKGRKRFTAHGRIINRRERFWRGIGEGQTLGATGYVGDRPLKNRFDRMFARANNGLGGALGRGADWMRDRQIARSGYLGPDGTPGPGPGPKGLWKLSSLKLNGPGTSIFGSRADKFYNGSFYNNWLSPTSNIGAKGPIEPRTGFGRAISNIKTGTRGVRASRFGAAVLGNKETGQKGFAGSMTGQMGTALGMQFLSSKMDESAQGSMALGSSLAMINPFVGAAVGFGGAAMNARTGGGGAVMGAAAGAAIGTMIAPGIGTAVGTVVGAIAGGIKGVFNRVKKEKEDSRAAITAGFTSILRNQFGVAGKAIADQGGVGASSISKIMPSYLSQISGIANKATTVMQGGGDPLEFIEDIYRNQDTYGMTLSEQQYKDMQKRPQTAIDFVLQQEGLQKQAGQDLNDTYNKRLNELTKILGMSEMEVENLARTLDFNLMDSTKSFTEVLKALGATMVKTSAEMRGMQTDVFVNGLSKFDEVIKQIESPLILDEKVRNFRDMMDAGGVGEKDIAQFFKDVLLDTAQLGGGGLQGALKLKSMYGVGGTAYTQKGGYLEGKESILDSQGGQTAITYMNDAIMQTGKNLAGFVNNALLTGAGGDQRYMVNADLFSGVLSRLGSAQAGALEAAVTSNTLFDGVDVSNLSSVEARLKEFDPTGKILNAGSIGLQTVASDADMSSSLGKISDMPEQLKEVFTGFIDEYKIFFESEANVPEWFTSEAFEKLIAAIGDDTSSPRGNGIGDTTSSRLAQTLGRHNLMDGALTGKRTITSAYRTTGLGSPSSDHIMGRAYDLVGQNLGGYSKMVHANGGFAEFHGVNSNRHLHVVPGPGMGDTAVPARMSRQSLSTGSATVNNNYTINVEAGPNATAEQIANITMRKIKLMQDNQRQRS